LVASRRLAARWRRQPKRRDLTWQRGASLAAGARRIGVLDAGRYSLAALKEETMAEAKLAPNMPEWMVKHTNLYLASGGNEGHMYKIDVPGRGEITAPALLLTTTGRKSGEKFIFPLFYGTEGGSYIIVASKGGAPEHPGWYRNILVNPDVEVQAGTTKVKARARTASGEERSRLWKKALEFWPPYADYALKTEREIPVVVLDPVH
jgi:deazaflavin-dependent oxidoreductase (nitroreductase family)